ncbi:MAG: hypothetical protein KDI75_02535 [Xanthomonadales bacterium]|nr:hypothetical protein [Xanthomonadales bacterium]
MARSAVWAEFPGPSKNFDFAGDKLKKQWPKLHKGDCEAFPDAGVVKAQLGKQAKDADGIAEQLQDAWRAFHRGDFQQAFEIGQSLGAVGASVACKAGGIHADYLLDDDKAKLSRYELLMQLAEEASEALPKVANAHYRRAFAIGRFSQGISIAKALKQGLAGKVRESLDATLTLEADHAEAHTALGLYHAEIIDKVGAMLGGLTYGAKAAVGEKHLERATKLTPDSPITWIEYGNGLMLLYGDKREDDAAEAYEKAAKLKPKDAMEWLDVQFAKSELE